MGSIGSKKWEIVECPQGCTPTFPVYEEEFQNHTHCQGCGAHHNMQYLQKPHMVQS